MRSLSEMPSLDDALNMTKSRATRRHSEAARKELARRRARAQQLASKALHATYPDDYDTFYRQALDKVHAERGPVPD
jgi:hypothetical protein